jgi:hypothetical protein
VEKDLARWRAQFSRKQIDQSRFAGAVGTDDGVEFAGTNFQRSVFDGGQTAEMLGEITHLQDCISHSVVSRLP